MCPCLRIQLSGYLCLTAKPAEPTGSEDARQTDLIWQAWNDSGKIYGCKLHDDLLNHAETCCPNRAVWLTRLAGINAQIGYKRRARQL